MKKYFIRNPETGRFEEIPESLYEDNKTLNKLTGLDKPIIHPWTILGNPPVEKDDKTTNKSNNID